MGDVDVTLYVYQNTELERVSVLGHAIRLLQDAGVKFTQVNDYTGSEPFFLVVGCRMWHGIDGVEAYLKELRKAP